VIAIYEDKINYPFLTNSIPQIGASNVHAKNITGAGQTICILDTGIDYTHPALGGGIGPGFKILGGHDFANNDTDPMDDDSHGTHVAGIIASSNSTFLGVAPDANLVAIRVCNSGCFDSDIIAGINYCLTNKTALNISVISMSLGSPTEHFQTACDNDLVSSAINTASTAGIAVVVASGNEGNTSGISSPACASGAISVGATDNTDTIASFSNTGLLLDLFAPGVSITSTILSNSFGLKSGTSMATPHVSGAIALLQQSNIKHTGNVLSPSETLSILKKTGINITDSNNNLMFPRINISQAINITTPVTSCVSDYQLGSWSSCIASNQNATFTDQNGCQEQIQVSRICEATPAHPFMLLYNYYFLN